MMRRLVGFLMLAGPILGFLAAPLAGSVRADVVHLSGGGKVEGKVIEKGEEITVEHRYGSITLPRSRVLRIEKGPTLADRYEEKRSRIDPEDPDAHVDLGTWLRVEGWESKAREEFAAAIELDPDHARARAALGQTFYEGEWRTEDEIMERKGWVDVDGEWLPPEEARRAATLEERRRIVKERQKAQREFTRKLQRLVNGIVMGTSKQSEKAHGELVTVAREIGSPDLEKYAGDVKAWSDAYWTRVRQYALTQVQATNTRLKRPIPTFTTSLGAATAPVTLQLPELAVISVKTTVMIPAGRGQ